MAKNTDHVKLWRQAKADIVTLHNKQQEQNNIIEEMGRVNQNLINQLQDNGITPDTNYKKQDNG